MGVTQVGDWAQAARFLQATSTRTTTAMHKAALQEAHLFRKQIVEGLASQAPAGKGFLPLSQNTIARRKFTRGGGATPTKALIYRGDLRNSITVQEKGKGDEIFVGVLRQAKTKDGKSMVNIAEINEFGSKVIHITMTPKMRRFLFAMFRKAKLIGHGDPRVSTGVISFRIPPRPFFRPVFEKLSPGAGKRFWSRVMREVMA